MTVDKGSGLGRDAVEALLGALSGLALFGRKLRVAPFARIVCTPPRTPSA